VTGLRAETPEGSPTVRAELVVGADGRHSIVREKAGRCCAGYPPA
jgi:2-polyprenyl-6-methoxyphenol hydroxylase-like FAD-dependent oxidoreductase